MLLSRLTRASGLWNNICPNSLMKTSSRSISKGQIEAQNLLDELYASVRSQKFEDIVVIQTKFNANPRYLILASAFNSRHLISGTEEVNKNYKIAIRKQDQIFAKLSISKDWNVIDFESIVVHLFSRECRNQFDIEQLWAVGEKYDDMSNFPPEQTAMIGGRPES